MKIKRMLTMCLTLTLALAITATAVAVRADGNSAEASLNVEARSAVLMDADTGTVVYKQNENERLPIASMVKIMTLLLTFERIDSGEAAESDIVAASPNAAAMGGSQAFLDAGSSYTLGELIKSIVVGSANDSCVAVAEHLCGSVEGFVSRMNERAAQLGMDNTNFVNCTGLPAAGQYCCALDSATMLRELIKHNKFFDYSTVWMFDFAHPSGRVTQLSNTNKLIRAYEGCDGGKTGFTNEAKYCLSATAKRGGTRLISVVCGAESSKVRNRENAKLFNYGFANYETKQLVSSKTVELSAGVSLGKQDTVKVMPSGDYFVFARRGDKSEYELREQIPEIKAPIAAGIKVGELEIYKNGEKIGAVDLVACENVGKISYLDVVDDMIKEW